MTSTQQSFLKKISKPPVLAISLYLCCMLIYGIQYLISPSEESFHDIWLYGGVATLIYALFTALLLLFVEQIQQHWNQSVLYFILLMIIQVGVASLITKQSIFELTLYRRILILISFVFLVLITIASLIKRIEHWSKNHDNFKKKQ